MDIRTRIIKCPEHSRLIIIYAVVGDSGEPTYFAYKAIEGKKGKESLIYRFSTCFHPSSFGDDVFEDALYVIYSR